MRVPLPREVLQASNAPNADAASPVPVSDQTSAQIQASAETTTRLGSRLMLVADRLQRQEDNTKVSAADNRAADAVRRALLDPKTGYLNTQGQAATGKSREDTFHTLASELDTIAAGLDNESQRAAFREASERRWLGAMAQADQHETRERTNWEYGEASARAQGAIVDAAEYWSPGEDPTPGDRSQGPQPATGATFFATAMDEVNHQADLKQLPADSAQRAAMLRDAAAQIHTRRLQRLLDGNDPTAAEEYLASIPAGQLDEQTRRRAASAVEGRKTEESSWQLSQFLQDKTPGDLGSQRKALDELRAGGHITQGVYDRTRARIEHDDQVQFAQAKRNEAIALQDFEQHVKANRVTSYELLPAAMQQKLKDTGAELTAKLFMLQGGQWVSTEVGLGAIARFGPEDYRKRTLDQLLMEFRPELNNEHLDLLARRWHDAHELPKPKSTPEADINSDVLKLALDAKLVPIDRDMTREEKLRYDMLERTVRDDARRRAGKDPVTEQHVRDAFAAQVSVLWNSDGAKPMGGTGGVPWASLLPGERQLAYTKIGDADILGTNLVTDAEALNLDEATALHARDLIDKANAFNKVIAQSTGKDVPTPTPYTINAAAKALAAEKQQQIDVVRAEVRAAKAQERDAYYARRRAEFDAGVKQYSTMPWGSNGRNPLQGWFDK